MKLYVMEETVITKGPFRLDGNPPNSSKQPCEGK